MKKREFPENDVGRSVDGGIQQVEANLRMRVSKYMSYLLRHNPEGLAMDEQGFVDFNELLGKLRSRFRVNREYILELIEEGNRRRFEIAGSKIRALYGHSVYVELELEEDRSVKKLYHGTTQEAASRILKEGLKTMRRKWVHLSPTPETAKQVGLRRALHPAILQIDAEAARRDGLKFYKATGEVYLCKSLAPKYVGQVMKLERSSK